ncbi:expressed unknown protein [Seminavis robusta]|uniref:Uncharacterized protein n=1 Tax=Seminavis robusta TaxID=568900 RepID=A0A9N8E4S1_9STRA|nr:expressed unknown protein [Seminavis robusta]|eukprot:Sro540_g163020.1 n/a (363) ;mRNA; r:39051-40139
MTMKIVKKLFGSSKKTKRTPNEKVVANYMSAWNRHCSIEENLGFYESDDTPLRIEDTPDMPAKMFMVEMDKIFKSFPDIHFKHGTIKEEKPGQVFVDSIRVSATHTGEPYAFANFPPVPTTNKHIINDPERFLFFLKNGKITVMQVISLGDMTGPPGLYMQIGGKLQAPTSTEMTCATSVSSTSLSNDSSDCKRPSAAANATVPNNIVEEHVTTNEKIVTRFMDTWNNTTSTVEDIRGFFADERVEIHFEESPIDTANFFAVELNKIHKSFPDISFQYESIKENKGGQVLVEELQVSATHRGEPYAYAHYPPIARTNKRVINDPECLWFTIKDGKITKMQLIALGSFTGPPGLYTQVGGQIC